jgi:hypothetical protein
MPDAIDRWENEGGAIQRMPGAIGRRRAAGSLPERAAARPAPGTRTHQGQDPPAQPVSPSADVPGTRQRPARH